MSPIDQIGEPLPEPETDDPVAISDHVLEVTRRAYMKRDADAFSERMLFPQTVGTFEGQLLLETRADFDVMFERTCAYFDTAGIIDFKRHTIAATFKSPDEIQATFVSQHLLKDFVLTKEMVAHGTLRLSDGLWKIAESQYASDSKPLSLALSGKIRKQRSP